MFEGQIYKESITCQDPNKKRFKQKEPSKEDSLTSYIIKNTISELQYFDRTIAYSSVLEAHKHHRQGGLN